MKINRFLTVSALLLALALFLPACGEGTAEEGAPNNSQSGTPADNSSNPAALSVQDGDGCGGCPGGGTVSADTTGDLPVVPSADACGGCSDQSACSTTGGCGDKGSCGDSCGSAKKSGCEDCPGDCTAEEKKKGCGDCGSGCGGAKTTPQ
jgi:hypothetical protein